MNCVVEDEPYPTRLSRSVNMGNSGGPSIVFPDTTAEHILVCVSGRAPIRGQNQVEGAKGRLLGERFKFTERGLTGPQVSFVACFAYPLLPASRGEDRRPASGESGARGATSPVRSTQSPSSSTSPRKACARRSRLASGASSSSASVNTHA